MNPTPTHYSAVSNNSIKSKGTVMPLVLNELGVTVAVPGNHEFDFGVNLACGLFNISRFPWILSNVPSLNNCSSLQTHYEDDHALYIGLWHPNLKSVLPSEIDSIDFDFGVIRNGKLVVALTHMNLDEDKLLGYSNSQNIDLILGGHDHDAASPVLDSVPIVKSLSEYREIQVIDVDEQKQLKFSSIRVNPGIHDCALQKTVDEYMSRFRKAITVVPFDIDTRQVRITSHSETIQRLLGEFLGKFVNADLIMLNAGVFRGNRLFHKGEQTLSFIMNVPLVELECSHNTVWLMLYYGLLTCDDMCGYRAQVLSKQEIQVNWLTKSLTFNKHKDIYRIITTEFQSEGKDGYHLLLECKLTNQKINTHLSLEDIY